MLHRRTLVCLSTALLLGISAGAHAQNSYPTKPVKFVVAFAPGGPADIIARLLGQRLSESLGQPVVVENRAGAGGNVASGIVAKAAPDGYTLMINTSSLAVNVSLSKNPGFDAEKDFTLASVVASSPNLLVAYPGLKAKNLQEIVTEAKSGKLNYGTAGAGTTPHLTAEYLFKVLAKVDVTHIPFQGAGPALNATMGGQVEMASVALPAAVEMVKGGKVRGLAVTSNKRVAALPDVPTVAESGFPGFEDYTWVGVFAPSKTPPDVVQHLNSEINKILRSADFQGKLAGVGFEPVGGSTKEAADYLKAELAKWAKVVKETGTKVE
ncbi:tripartite tricarboxylate transporter substrate binding protein [Limnohabitans sp. JirII-31]|uniref:Bug family tripartite tricarboxylate transporter substrate binding protein n=1 Tax=Limnohabitans sp. JirII-31 TaxID=1977908 RepID=UPI001303FF60|nr:tripartite tricarboxylate transporter substrate binding protein [Limnohabitans sp. JirII-31]